MHEIMEKVREDFDRIFPPDKHNIRYVRWQTWPFDQEKPKINYSCGICEMDDFLCFMKSSCMTIGQKTFWREINVIEM